MGSSSLGTDRRQGGGFLKSLLFGSRAGATASSETAPFPPSHTNGHAGWFLSEDDFARALTLESKRAERSRKLRLLMLLDSRSLLAGSGAAECLSNILAALSTSTRETDIRGWYRRSSVIGIIFTEITEPEKELVASAILERVRDLLRINLSAEAAQRIVISLNFLPEDWATGHPESGAKRNDLVVHNDRKRSARVLKRAIDVLGSSLALVALAPVFVLIALLIKLTSKGSVIFSQERVGRRGRTFRCFKFRSMYAASDPGIHKAFVRDLISSSRGENSAQREAQSHYKIKNDPRVTPLGRLLRRASLDELPQFWNVLKGEMSLVGPRPAIPYEVESYDRWHWRRVLDVNPGITGLWQVHGRSRTSFDEMVRLDLRYANRWSIWLDLKILLKTPRAVLSGEGAY